mgnify:CR=1 FL=1
MTSLFDVGKSAIQAYRQSLSVTGQNIANINTDGYVRREADLREVTASQGGITSIANQSGLGVRVADIRRSFDELLTSRKLSASANFEQSDSFLKQVEKLEDLLLPGESDLGTQIGGFFRALNDLAAAPSDLAPRAVAIESGNSLAEAFNSTAVQLEQLKKATLDRTSEAITSLNTITKELASVNDKILSASQSGRSPNSLLDLRDKLIGEISKLADVTANYTDRGVANVTIGSSSVGPGLVTAGKSTKVGFIERYDKIGGLQIILNPLASKTPTSQLSSGKIAGLSEAYGSVRGVIDQVNSLTAELSTRLNTQHRLGVALDGSNGGDLFSTISVEAIRSQATSTDVDVELVVTDANKLPSHGLDLTYSAETEVWSLSNSDVGHIASGRTSLKGPGFDVSLSGVPRAGDRFLIAPGSNTAGQIKFLLTRPHDFAAASPDLVTASNANLSDAELSMRRISLSPYPDNGNINDNLANSLSAVEAQEFINDGLITTIPAGTERVDIASFTKQASAKFHFSGLGLQNINQFSFTRLSSGDDGPHTFNIGYARAYPNDQSGNYWQDAADVADAMNSGILKSTANQSLFDLGMRASGSGGNLTFTTADGNFVSSGIGMPEISTGGITNVASVADAIAASDLQLFTREGRHIAGVALTDAQITEFMTSANGFDDSAVYSAEYLNNTKSAYRGVDMDVSFAGGMHTLKIGSNGVAPALAQGSAIVPGNATLAQNMSIALPDGSLLSAPITVGASASSAAHSLNEVLQNSGVIAEAKTQIELFDFQNTGVVSFDLEAANRVPIEISADVTTTNLSNLAIAMNKVSTETGVTAVTSTDKTRIILTSDNGDDIAISKLGAASPAFFGRFVDDDGVAETSPIGTVSASGAFKTPLASTSAVTDVLVAGATVSSNTVSGSGADLNISSDTSGNYTVTINSGGVGSANPYVVGETFTVDGTLIGGTTSTHDVTITVAAVDANGVITSATATGFAPGITQAQTTLSSFTTDGSGSGATLDVTLADGVATVVVNAVGDGYDVGDTITILGSAIGGTDGVNDLTISVTTLGSSSLVSFGATVSSNRIDTARFSGSVSLSSSASFTLTETNGTKSSAQNPALGGIVNIHSNVAGDIKRVEYDISEALESGGSTLDGLRAIAPSANYQLTVPSSNASISFTANISNSDLSVTDKQSVNTAVVKEIRSQAPISSLSGGSTVSQTQVVSYSFQRTEAVQPNIDSVNLKLNGTTISVDLNDIDGSSTAASSADDVTAAIIRAVNNASLGVTATSSGTPPNYGVTLSADNPGVPFTVEAFEFNDVTQTVAQTQFSLTSETPALSLPDEDTSVAVKYGDQIYTLTMQEGEVTVAGPESDRLTAYFDIDSRLQIFGGGSLSGSTITVLGDTELSGNSDAAEKFGLVNSTTRLTGQLFTLTSSMDDLDFNFGGQVVTVSLDLSGNVTTTPSSVTGLTLTWQSETATTGRLKAEYDSELYSITFDNPTDALGFKTADREISVSENEILVSSTDKKAFSISASAQSIADTRFQLNELPHEDLLVFATGGGARSIGAEYNSASTGEDLTKYEIRAVGENGNVIEIFDADTNHSIATRVVSGDQQTTYRNFEFTLSGRVENGDSFILSQDASGKNDGRNIDEIINLRSGDPRDPTKLGFQDMFGVMIAGVGSSVNSSKIASDIQEENMMAAKEAEAEFAGVNLDTEAAALIEFQQAYQASARILSTARELFQSLMEVV